MRNEAVFGVDVERRALGQGRASRHQLITCFQSSNWSALD